MPKPRSRRLARPRLAHRNRARRRGRGQPGGPLGIHVARQGALDEARRAFALDIGAKATRARGPALGGALRPRLPRRLAHDRAARRGRRGPVGRVAAAPGRGERAPPLPAQPRRGRPHRGALVRRPPARARRPPRRRAGALGLGEPHGARRGPRSTPPGRASPRGCRTARPRARSRAASTIETEVDAASLLDPGEPRPSTRRGNAGCATRRAPCSGASRRAARPAPAGRDRRARGGAGARGGLVGPRPAHPRLRAAGGGRSWASPSRCGRATARPTPSTSR